MKLLTFILILLLSSLLVGISNVESVKASETIYIRADGSVEGTDKIQRDGNVYTFIDDIFDSCGIVVERDNIVVDGAGYTLQGTGSGKGIDLSDRNTVTIQNVEIKEFNDGIRLFEAANNTLIGNTIAANNQWGIRLAGSSNNIVSGNNITNNDYGGIVVMGSDNNKILENTITDNFRGLDLTASENNTVSGNHIANNIGGIALENMYNSIVENTITNNSNFGIHLYGAGYNNIIGNNITNNGRGILVSICYSNIIHQNNFINNTNNVETDNSNSIWDNGEKGNYWDDYAGVDNDGDGIGDTPHIINENNQDNHPLTNVIPEFPSWAPLLIVLSVLAVAVAVYKLRLTKIVNQHSERCKI
jgi:parallel beta-helix repeat protein